MKMKSPILTISTVALTLALFTGCGDTAEDDATSAASDPFQNTIAYTLNDEVEDSVNITDNKEDVFKFEVKKTGVYTAYLEVLKGTVEEWTRPAYVSIYNQDKVEMGTESMSGEVGAWDRLTFDVTQAGNYYARIYRPGGDTKYRLSIHTSNKNGYVQDSDREYNDVLEMATPITLAQASATINDSLNITDIKDIDDWYQLPLITTGTYTVDFEILGGSVEGNSFYTYLYIHAEDGTELNRIYMADIIGNKKSVTFEANLAENYYIHIDSKSLTKTNYSFKVYQ